MAIYTDFVIDAPKLITYKIVDTTFRMSDFQKWMDDAWLADCSDQNNRWWVQLGKRLEEEHGRATY